MSTNHNLLKKKESRSGFCLALMHFSVVVCLPLMQLSVAFCLPLMQFSVAFCLPLMQVSVVFCLPLMQISVYSVSLGVNSAQYPTSTSDHKKRHETGGRRACSQFTWTLEASARSQGEWKHLAADSAADALDGDVSDEYIPVPD